jgi:hypothetical protein
MTMTITKLIPVAFTCATAAVALFGITSASARAQEDFSHMGAGIPWQTEQLSTPLPNTVASAYWKSQETSTPLPVGFLPLTDSIAGASILNGSPEAAYFEVTLRYCIASSGTSFDAKSALTEAAAIVYEEVLMGTHGGNCESFFLEEIGSRLDVSDGRS